VSELQRHDEIYRSRIAGKTRPRGRGLTPSSPAAGRPVRGRSAAFPEIRQVTPSAGRAPSGQLRRAICASRTGFASMDSSCDYLVGPGRATRCHTVFHARQGAGRLLVAQLVSPAGRHARTLSVVRDGQHGLERAKCWPLIGGWRPRSPQ
jgi:hypothetical protein